MALLNLGDDPWLLEYESCEKLQREIMEQLIERKNEAKSSEIFARLSANIRLRLKQYTNETSQLKHKLSEAASSQSITYDELERRNRQLELLQSKGIQMQKLFDDYNRIFNRDRAQLLGNSGLSTWGTPDDELIGSGPSNQSVDSLRNQQKQMLEDQERGLENLSNIISRQKNIAQTISTEVDLQNDIIDDLGVHIDRTDQRITTETRSVVRIDRKDKTCAYWVIIVLLFISIITVAAI